MKIFNIATNEVIFEDKDSRVWVELIRKALSKNVNLRGANLGGANLGGANLRGAYLVGADLGGADLVGANLSGVKGLTYDQTACFKITPETGSFHAWKKTTKGIIEVLIPEHAKRCNAIGSRKCRASEVIVLGGEGVGGGSPTHTQKKLVYNLGKTVKADKFDDSVTEECASGIHFFMTKKEAEDYT